MKKLLLVTTAIVGVAMLATPATAAVDIELGGYFKGYVVDADSDVANDREQDFRRAVEIHADGETTLDNGLTVGAHMELDIAENGSAAITGDEVYAYLSGGWGRVNVGLEDGAAFLLQVGAPSADANVDGMSVSIEAHESASNWDETVFGASQAFDQDAVDYAHRDFNDADRLTYMSPKFNGFQAGVSYAPAPGVATGTGTMSADSDLGGFFDASDNSNNTAVQYEDLIELSARYNGEYQGFGFAVGAGYSTADLEAKQTAAQITALVLGVGDWVLDDGVDTYNIGANVMFQNFSLGGSYMVAETSRTTDDDTAGGVIVRGDIERTTYVIGGAYDNGPYHVGVSYLNQETDMDALTTVAAGSGQNNEIASNTREVDKLTIGGGYSFGPGMTFRGSVAWGEYDTTAGVITGAIDSVTAAAANNDFTQVGVGIDVRF